MSVHFTVSGILGAINMYNLTMRFVDNYLVLAPKNAKDFKFLSYVYMGDVKLDVARVNANDGDKR